VVSKDHVAGMHARTCTPGTQMCVDVLSWICTLAQASEPDYITRPENLI